jgi:hypothetical protein
VFAILLLLSAFPQDKVSIPRSGKSAYARSVPKCRDAERKIDSDPRGAIEILDSILSDGRVKKRECRIRWETRPGDYSKWYDFFPYQFRARARIKLAESAVPGDALKLLARARGDLEESVRRGLKTSGNQLTDVLARIRKLESATAEVDPLPGFRKEWTRIVKRDDFKGAREHVRKEGGFLTEAQKKKFLAETDQACLDYIDGASMDFLSALDRLVDVEDLQSISRSLFARKFSLPETEDFTVTAPLFDWCLAAHKTLEEVRKGREALPSLFDRSVEAIALPKEVSVSAFLAMEKLAFDIVWTGIESRANSSRDEPSARRKILRTESDNFAALWKGFEERLLRVARGKTFFLKEIPGREFAPLWSRFPVDAAELKEIPSRLYKTIESPVPGRILGDIGQDMVKLRDRFDTLSIESRRDVVMFEIVTLLLARFLEGETVLDVARDRDVKALGRELKSLRGDFKVTRYGPKVAAVFADLR